MNLIFTRQELLDAAANHASGLPCLARRHKVFLLTNLSEGGVGLKSYLVEQGLHPDETALIGSNETDWRAAQAAGISAWAALCDLQDMPVVDRKHLASLAGQYTEIVLPDWAAFADELQRREAAASRAYPITTVGALIVDEAGHLFLVQTRKWSGKWGIPGGKVDYGEKLETALRREVREETGLIAQEVEFMLAHEAIESPEFYRPRHFILLNYRVKVTGIKPPFALNHESVKGGWMTLPEAAALDLNEPTRRLLANWTEAAKSSR